MSAGGEFSCAVTGFAGLEEEILRLRNTNREIPETVTYLRWRYQHGQDDPAPCVFWLLGPGGERVGMAAAIFRPYWVNGVRLPVAVIGDISLDARLRGRGLGRVLLGFMTRYLDEHFPAYPALVIPTESARRALTNVGWFTVGELAPLVCVLDPAPYLSPLVRSQTVAAAAARPLRACARLIIRSLAPRDGSWHFSDAPDPSFAGLGRGADTHNVTVRDLGLESLTWRYAQHPHTRFTFASFRRAGKMCGFLVFEDRSAEGAYVIYDLAAASPADMRAMLASFVLRGLAIPGLAALRVLLDERHPARAQLRRTGFIARAHEAVFQVHSRGGSAEGRAWRITQGDKDT